MTLSDLNPGLEVSPNIRTALGHFQVSTVVRQVISCKLCEGPKVKPLCGWSVGLEFPAGQLAGS